MLQRRPAQEGGERGPAEIRPLRQLRQLTHDEFEIIADRRNVGARLIAWRKARSYALRSCFNGSTAP
jgi:hypothetical protein